MNILFSITDWSEINPKTESTLRLIHEAILRKHTVGIFYPQNITIRNNVTYAFVKLINKLDKVPINIDNFYKKVTFTEKLLPVEGFDSMFLRANPPVDNLMLNFLDSVKDDVFIVNDIDGIRKANNKTYTAMFHDPKNEFLPITHVSKNQQYLKKIIFDSDSEKMILKPLAGYGGSGVIVLEKSAPQNIDSLLDFYIEGKYGKNYVILQEYIEGAEEGDIRILLLNGEPIGAMKRVPANGDIRSNVHAGGTVQKHPLTKQEVKLCKKIGPQLVKDGLYFVGIDIINGKLLEVNVLSPGGIVNINRLNKTKLQRLVLDFVENKVKQKEDAISQRLEFRKLVNNV